MRNAFSAIFLSVLSFPVLALPILTESSDGSGLQSMIHPDHEDVTKVYFFPDSGKLEKNRSGVPRFGMSYWTPQNPSDSAGYFSAIFKLEISDELKTSIEDHKKKGKQVSVIPVKKSHVHFKQDENGGRVMADLFKEVSLPPLGGRAGDSIGMSATLTPMGATVLRNILTSGGQGAELQYCYEIVGVSPVFHATIQLNYKKIYEHFVANARGGRLWWKWSVRHEAEKLIENQNIKIQINGGNANKYDYIMALVDRFVEKFMTPVLENRRGGTSGRFSVSHTKIIEDRELTFDLKQREIINREYCVGLELGELKEFPWLIVNAD